jgi:predicted metal-dependent phosphoesterase TrpH
LIHLGLTTISVTDHDTVASLAKVRTLTAAAGIRLVSITATSGAHSAASRCRERHSTT